MVAINEIPMPGSVIAGALLTPGNTGTNARATLPPVPSAGQPARRARTADVSPASAAVPPYSRRPAGGAWHWVRRPWPAASRKWSYLQNNAVFRVACRFVSRFTVSRHMKSILLLIGKIASRCVTRHGATPNWTKIPASIRHRSTPGRRASGPPQIRHGPSPP